MDLGSSNIAEGRGEALDWKKKGGAVEICLLPGRPLPPSSHAAPDSHQAGEAEFSPGKHNALRRRAPRTDTWGSLKLQGLSGLSLAALSLGTPLLSVNRPSDF